MWYLIIMLLGSYLDCKYSTKVYWGAKMGISNTQVVHWPQTRVKTISLWKKNSFLSNINLLSVPYGIMPLRPEQVRYANVLEHLGLHTIRGFEESCDRGCWWWNDLTVEGWDDSPSFLYVPINWVVHGFHNHLIF